MNKHIATWAVVLVSLGLGSWNAQAGSTAFIWGTAGLQDEVGGLGGAAAALEGTLNARTLNDPLLATKAGVLQDRYQQYVEAFLPVIDGIADLDELNSAESAHMALVGEVRSAADLLAQRLAAGNASGDAVEASESLDLAIDAGDAALQAQLNERRNELPTD